MKRQNIYNLLIVYLGLFLGFFNTVFRTKAITTEEIGLISIIISISGILQFFTLLGIPSIILKYYTKRKSENEKAGLLLFFSTISFFAFIIISLIFYYNKQIILKCYHNELLFTYINYIIVFLFVNTIVKILEQISRVIYKSVITNFYRNFLLKIIHLVLIILVIALNLKFETYIKSFLVINFFIILLMITLIVKNINFKKLEFSFIFKDINIYFKYGFFMLISGLTLKLINQIDKLMIAYFYDLKDTGIYTIAVVISSTINLIGTAFMRVIQPELSKAFAANNFDEISKIYKSNANQQIYFGIYLFSIIVIFSTYILNILGNDYKKGIFVLIYLSIAYLINISTGMCGTIINLSKYFKINFYFNIILLILVIITNYIFIPKYGITGAALATGFSIAIHNIIKTVFVKLKFNVFPFSYQNIKLFISIFITIPFILFLKKYITFFDENLVYIAILSAAGFVFYDFILTYVFKMRSSLTYLCSKKIISLKG